MEFFNTTQLMVPLLQLMLLLLGSTILLLMGRIKVALGFNYAFILYWGYVSNVDLFNSIEKADACRTIYMGFGVGIVLLAVIGFILQSK
jgi:hypothetical protein